MPREEWLDELKVAAKEVDRDGFLTMKEIMDALKFSKRIAYRKLQELDKDNRLDTKKVNIKAIDGAMRQVPVYRVKPK